MNPITDAVDAMEAAAHVLDYIRTTKESERHPEGGKVTHVATAHGSALRVDVVVDELRAALAALKGMEVVEGPCNGMGEHVVGRVRRITVTVEPSYEGCLVWNETRRALLLALPQEPAE